jgi:hypothetical protein
MIMGKLLYGTDAIVIGFEDRALAHLHVVISAKLRRGEKFFFSWQDNVNVGSGRSSIWIEQSIPLYFKFSGTKPIAINKAWIEELIAAANSNSGLVFMVEPGPASAATALPHGHV